MEDQKKPRTDSHSQEIQNTIHEILSQFKNKKGQNLNKEHVREHSIRNHKKFLRIIYENSQKKYQKLYKSTHEDSKQSLLDFAQHAKENISNLLEISKTEAGPASDGKPKTRNNPEQKKYFNDFFVRDYFTDPIVKESFQFYIKFEFSTFLPVELCNSFRYFCCKSKKHKKDCLEKWQKLFEFFEVFMFKDIEERFSCSSLTGSQVSADYTREGELMTEGLEERKNASIFEVKYVDRAVGNDEDVIDFELDDRDYIRNHLGFSSLLQGAVGDQQSTQRNLINQMFDLLNQLNPIFSVLASSVMK